MEFRVSCYFRTTYRLILFCSPYHEPLVLSDWGFGRGLARVQERPGADSTLPACIVEAGLVGDRCDHTSHSSKMFARDCEKKVLEGNRVLSELRELVATAGVDILQDVSFVNILAVVDMNASSRPREELQDSAGIAHDACILLGLESHGAASIKGFRKPACAQRKGRAPLQTLQGCLHILAQRLIWGGGPDGLD